MECEVVGSNLPKIVLTPTLTLTLTLILDTHFETDGDPLQVPVELGMGPGHPRVGVRVRVGSTGCYEQATLDPNMRLTAYTAGVPWFPLHNIPSVGTTYIPSDVRRMLRRVAVHPRGQGSLYCSNTHGARVACNVLIALVPG